MICLKRVNRMQNRSITLVCNLIFRLKLLHSLQCIRCLFSKQHSLHRKLNAIIIYGSCATHSSKMSVYSMQMPREIRKLASQKSTAISLEFTRNLLLCHLKSFNEKWMIKRKREKTCNRWIQTDFNISWSKQTHFITWLQINGQWIFRKKYAWQSTCVCPIFCWHLLAKLKLLFSIL